MVDHGVQDRQQLAHAGGQRDLCGLPLSAQARVERFEPWLITDRHKSTHRQCSPHRGAIPPNRPAAPERATIPVQRGYSDEGGQPLAAQCAPLRQVEQERACTDRANTGDAAEQFLPFPPSWTRPQRGVEVVVQRRQPDVEPGDRRLDVRLEPWGCLPKTVLFGRPHGDQLPPPCQEGAAFVGLGVREGPGGRLHRLGNMGQGLRVEGICLGQLSGGFSNVARVAGIDHHHWEAGGGQCRHHGPLIAPPWLRG
jgi:hypothetical protein